MGGIKVHASRSVLVSIRVVGVELSSSGALFVGGTNRGWGSRGPKEFSVERLDWTGKVLLKSKRCGCFRRVSVDFYKAVDAGTIEEVKNLEMKTFTYIYREQYGSPEVDSTTPIIRSVKVAQDKMSADLQVEGLQVGHVHELKLKNVKSAEGEPVLHPEAYYTLNYLAK